MQNKVQLITYPDSLGENLVDLKYFLDTYLNNKIGGVHILPFYPSSADRGFSPLTHLKVDKKFGSFKDIRKISKKYDVMADIVLNHISAKSSYFLDYLHNGKKSRFADMFLTYDKVFGKVPEDKISQVLSSTYSPRDSLPFTNILFLDNSSEKIWTTFSSEQIDLDWSSNLTKDLIKSFLLKLKKENINFLRLDAIGYTFKEAGNSSFFSYEVFKNIDWIKKIVGEEVKLLPEIHYKYDLQLEIAKNTDFTYDFQVSILLLHAIYFKTFKNLSHWIDIRPKNMITVLDTHDGIGIIDAEGLLTDYEIEETKKKLFLEGGNPTLRASGRNSNNVDVYQINCTYYSALNDENSYLISRAIQFFIPGIPQVYYVGLFAGKNDLKLLKNTNNGRDINRHYYSLEEIKKEIKKPVVQSLLKLMEFRSNYQAFNGNFIKEDLEDDTCLKLRWKKGHFETILFVDIKNNYFRIIYTKIVEHKWQWLDLDL